MPLDRVNAYVKEKGFDAAKKNGDLEGLYGIHASL